MLALSDVKVVTPGAREISKGNGYTFEGFLFIFGTTQGKIR